MSEYRLPATHTLDWFDRCGQQLGATLIRTGSRLVTIDLNPAAVADLRADAEHYATCMGPADTGDLDYRPAARRVLTALTKAATQ